MARSCVNGTTSVISQIITIIGADKAREVAKIAGGEHIYWPHEIIDIDRDKKIKQEFDAMLRGGSTCMSAYSSLAQKYSLSARRIRQIAA
jgi:Mor family transcriptional regulator